MKLGQLFLFFLQKLVELLQDKDPEVREQAKIALMTLLRVCDK